MLQQAAEELSTTNRQRVIDEKGQQVVDQLEMQVVARTVKEFDTLVHVLSVHVAPKKRFATLQKSKQSR